MGKSMRIRQLFWNTLLVFASAALSSCGSSSTSSFNPGGSNQQGAGSVVVLAQDAPLASVVFFQVTIEGLTATDGTNTVNLLSQPQDVEFARLTGLRTLLDLNSVPAGTYTSVTATLMNPVIGFLDTTTSPPSIQKLSGNPAASTVTIALNPGLTVTDGGLVALLFDFNLGKSLQLDATGMVTGTVMPDLRLRAIPSDAPEADIDELRGGVVSANPTAGSFVMQIPNGRMLTVDTDASTDIEPPSETISSFDTNTIVEVSGRLDRATLTLKAAEVDVISHDHFVAGGLLTDVRPPSGPANQIDVFIRRELPVLSNLQPDTIGTFNLTGNELYFIRRLHTPLALFVFNQSAMVPGQRITVGGSLSATPMAIHRVTLYPQGLEGAWVPGSTNVQSGNQGTFQFNSGGLAGVLFKGAVTVLTSGGTRFGGGLNGLADLSGPQPIHLRVVGLVLKDPNTGNPTIVARGVARLN